MRLKEKVRIMSSERRDAEGKQNNNSNINISSSINSSSSSSSRKSNVKTHTHRHTRTFGTPKGSERKKEILSIFNVAMGKYVRILRLLLLLHKTCALYAVSYAPIFSLSICVIVYVYVCLSVCVSVFFLQIVEIQCLCNNDVLLSLKMF